MSLTIVLLSLVIGAVAGFLSSLGSAQGSGYLGLKIVYGIVGAVLGSWIATQIQIGSGSLLLYQVILAIVGAFVMAFIGRLFRAKV